MSSASSSKSVGPTLVTITVVIVPVAALIAILSSFSFPPQLKATIAIVAVLVLTVLSVLLLRRQPLVIRGRELLVRATVGYQRIPLANVTGVSKVRRKRKS
ncbi:MAG: hypothetical protein P8J87_14240, partial [Verrucomicrobiales bacterium]|nr:hypothetical protein [Verrucomicrobiales bacterium]